ncbi:hypothetical protein AAVH_42969, partial [Aphelenchoides avenae]
FNLYSRKTAPTPSKPVEKPHSSAAWPSDSEDDAPFVAIEKKEEPQPTRVTTIKWYSEPLAKPEPKKPETPKILDQIKAELEEKKHELMDKRVLAEKKAKEEYCAAYLELEKTTLAQVENLYPSILARLATPVPFVHFLARKEPRWTLFGVIDPTLLKSILVKHKKSGRELTLDGTDLAPNQVSFFWPRLGRKVTIAEYMKERWNFNTEFSTAKTVFKRGGGWHRDHFPVDIFDVVAIRI